MPRRHLVPALLTACAAGVVSAQAPPPRLLPASITGRPATPSVTPAGGNAAAAAPIDRFLGRPSEYPPETVQAVAAVRLASDWLARLNQPDGRFVPGLDPAARQWVAADSDFRQALAALALAEGARFTGDERSAARAGGAVLTLLTRTKLDPADPACRVPVAAENAAGTAAAIALAVYAIPAADARLAGDADALVRFVARQVRPDCSFDLPDSADSDLACGLALRALAAQASTNPQAGEAFGRAVAFQTKSLAAEATPSHLAAVLPALVDHALMLNKEPAAVAAAFAAADRLCAAQLTFVPTQHAAWLGAFPAKPGVEPAADSAACALALCHAARLTRQIPDGTRFVKYRTAAASGLAFVRTLQHPDDTADAGESFQARYVAGGVRASAGRAELRTDAAAVAVLGHLAFLECGTERPLR